MAYIENPKTKGSGIICAIPHSGRCPNNCRDCFFQSGRGYLEPLDENLPNMPSPSMAARRVVRVNDGHDSNIDSTRVMVATGMYKDRFFNTAIPNQLEGFIDPVVLTVNPGEMIDNAFHTPSPIAKNLMFVRALVNTWNLSMVRRIVDWFTPWGVPVVLTFMAYFESPIPKLHSANYVWKTRTSNPYWCIKPDVRESIISEYDHNKRVHVCGGRRTDLHCRFCGNCLREYYATKERIREA